MNRLSATLLGALIGAGVALVLAPSSGETTRRRLRENVDALQDRAQRQWREGRLRVTELVGSSQERANEIAAQLEDELGNERPQQRATDRFSSPRIEPERGI
jgi:gas vesicle protein